MHDGSKLIDFDDLGGAGYQRTLKVIHCDSAASWNLGKQAIENRQPASTPSLTVSVIFLLIKSASSDKFSLSLEV